MRDKVKYRLRNKQHVASLDLTLINPKGVHNGASARYSPCAVKSKRLSRYDAVLIWLRKKCLLRPPKLVHQKYVIQLQTVSKHYQVWRDVANKGTFRRLKEAKEKDMTVVSYLFVCDRKGESLSGGERWIRTIEVVDDRFTVCSLWPLGNLPIFWSW